MASAAQKKGFNIIRHQKNENQYNEIPLYIIKIAKITNYKRTSVW